jgi:hypothetical protein
MFYGLEKNTYTKGSAIFKNYITVAEVSMLEEGRKSECFMW